jgi:hypothetical protein
LAAMPIPPTVLRHSAERCSECLQQRPGVVPVKNLPGAVNKIRLLVHTCLGQVSEYDQYSDTILLPMTGSQGPVRDAIPQPG